MNKLIIWLCTSLCAYAQLADASLLKQWLDSKPEDRRIPTADSPLRAAMLAEVHEALTKRSEVLQHGSRLRLLAIELGDEQMLQTYAGPNFTNAYGGVTRDAEHFLERTSEPTVIPAVSIYLKRDEPVNEIYVEDQGWARPSVAATRIILNVLQRSDRFSSDTRKWAANEYYKPLNLEGARHQVRAFWEENAKDFAAKNYQAVRPPGTQPGQSPALQPVVNKSNSAPALPAAARPRAKRAGGGPETNAAALSQPVAGAPGQSAALPESSTAVAVWPWLLLAVGAVGCWLWWRSR